MEHEKEHDLRVLQLSFIGKILSGLTHEIKNHLAFLKESAGLLGDLIKLESSSAKDKDELYQHLKIIHSIEEQIERTSELCKYLNCFAHRMDKPFSTFNVNESLEELLALLYKFVSQKRINLEKDFYKDLPVIYSDPAGLQFLVFCLIEEKLRRLDKNSSIIVKTALSDRAITIRVITKGDFIETVEEGICSHEINQYVIKQLGGSISQKGEEITIMLPVSMPST